MRSYCNSGTHAHVHEISNQDDGAVFYDSVSVCFLRACTAASRERAERQRGGKAEGIDGYKGLFVGIDMTEW